MVTSRYIIDAVLYLHDYFDYIQCEEDYGRKPNVENEVTLCTVRASEIVSVDEYDGEHTQITCTDGYSNWKCVVCEPYDEVVNEYNKYKKMKTEYEREGFEVLSKIFED